jgi:outer membrane protein OmpA-like peptidoglycan-associated protein
LIYLPNNNFMALDLNKKDGSSSSNVPTGESKKTGSFNLSKETDAPKKKFNLSKDEGAGSAATEVQAIEDTTQGAKKGNRMLLWGALVIIAFVAIYFVVSSGQKEAPGVSGEGETAAVATEETTASATPEASGTTTTPVTETAATTPPAAGTPETTAQPAASTVPSAPIPNQTPVLEFSPSSTAPTQINNQTIAKLVDYLNANAGVNITLMGYASSEGDLSYNQTLSQQRADQVKSLLVSKGIKASRISAIGKGIENPVADNGTIEGRSKNRRVEISYN